MLLALPARDGRCEPRDNGELAPGGTAFGQEAGDLEIAFATQWIDAGDAEETQTSVALEYGLTGRLQLGFELPHLVVNPRASGEPSRSGLDSAGFSLQVGLLGADAPVALSLVAQADVPVGGRWGRGGEVVPAGAVLLARVFGSTELFGGVRSTVAHRPAETEVEAGCVFLRGRVATEIAVSWIGTGSESAWELSPEIIIEDVGPFDLGIGAPRTFLDGRDEWGVAVTLTIGYP